MRDKTVLSSQPLFSDSAMSKKERCGGALSAPKSQRGSSVEVLGRALLLAAACGIVALDGTTLAADTTLFPGQASVVASSHFAGSEPQASVLLSDEAAGDYGTDSVMNDATLSGNDADVVYYTSHGGRASRHGFLDRLIGQANPRWEFTADALLLWQGNITNRVFYTDPAGNSVLESSQGQTPVSVGPRFGLFFNLDQHRALELNYFQASPFRGEQTTVPSNGDYTMNDLAGFDLSGVNGAAFESDALIQSFEANWRRGNGGPLTWLVGFRWVDWYDTLNINDAAGQFVDTFNTVAGNDLYGAQLGLDAMLWNRDQAISIDGVAKAGVYYNNAYQQISANDGVARGPMRASANETSFFGELGITMDTRITSWLSWRLGYSAFWLSGVAEADGQLSSTNLQVPNPPPATINTGGSVLLHGLTTGIEARW